MGLGSNGGVVGYSVKGSGETAVYTGFAFLNGAFAEIIPPGTNAKYGSLATAVSPNGLIAGMYMTDDYQYTSFVTYGSTYNVVSLNTEVGVFQPTGVTDSGVIVGIDCALTLWGNECFSLLVTDGVAVDVSFPGSVETNAYGINNKGDVVGWYFDGDYVQHGFIFSSAKSLYYGPIDVPGSTGTALLGITDKDVVTGATQLNGVSVGNAIVGTPN
jgi:probable HAF family extracellular repeat protein